MTAVDSIRLAVSGLRGGLLRTLLTILSLAVGVSAVLTVLALGDAGENRVENEIATLGVNKIWIRPVSEDAALQMTDAQLVCDATQAPACEGAYTMATAAFGRKAALVQVAGFDASSEAVHAPKVLEGRMLRPSDFLDGSAVCLIDEVLSDCLGADVTGEYLRLGNRRFRVVGVIKPMSFQTLSAGTGMVILPLSAFIDTFDQGIAEITISVQPGQQTSEIARLAASVLSEDDFRTDTLEKEINAAREIVRIFVMVLLCVAMVSMLSGGIGVMNVLMIAVRERRQEIGLMKAIGGTAGQVALLFLLEAAAYAVLGGILGMIVGQGMILLCGAVIGLDATMRAGQAIPVLLAAALLGICFGVAPALKAAALLPVDALRSE